MLLLYARCLSWLSLFQISFFNSLPIIILSCCTNLYSWYSIIKWHNHNRDSKYLFLVMYIACELLFHLFCFWIVKPCYL
jgi:formate hydrogenlyase subunit 3/multisubunit Na+/H+ antiporter MnhD subunit